MDKRISSLLIGLLILTLCAAIIVLISRKLEIQAADPPADSGPASESYTVKEYNGEIAVFCNNSTVPTFVYEIPVYTLPEYDQSLLKTGITAKTEDELQSILADYTS